MPRLQSSGARLPLAQWTRGVFQGIGVLAAVAIASVAAPSSAVEEIVFQAGPLKTHVQVADLEAFATTGEVPPGLKLYRPLLTPTTQQALQNYLTLDPKVRDRVLTDLLQSQNGQQLLAAIATVSPTLTATVLETTIRTTALSPEGLNMLGLLRTLPGDTLTIQAPALLSMGVKIGLARWEQASLSNVLSNGLQRTMPTDDLDFDPAVPGTQVVDRWSMTLRDIKRDRLIPVDVYWSPDTQGPLVLLSHGFGADRRFLGYLGAHLASYGLTVVSVEHPGSNVDALSQPEGLLLPAGEFIDRPKDISFVLDHLTQLNKSSFFLRGRFNLDQVTLVGHSLGGYTGLVLAGAALDDDALKTFCAGLPPEQLSPADWLACAATDLTLPATGLADDRITQLVVMNPITGHLFGKTGLQQVTIPTLVLTSTQDGVTPVAEQQLQPFEQLSGPRSLIAVIGGTHLSVGDPDNMNPALTQIPFMPEVTAAETEQLRAYLQGTLLSFVMQQTPEAEAYQRFLSPEYAEAFSTAVLPLRYGDHLPQAVTRWLWVKEAMTDRLTPPLRQVASLLHLELIDLQHFLATVPEGAIASLSFHATALSQHFPAATFDRRTLYAAIIHE